MTVNEVMTRHPAVHDDDAHVWQETTNKKKDEWRLREMSVGWRTEADLNEWGFQFRDAVRVSNPHDSQVTHGSQDMEETANRWTMFPGRL